MNKNNSELQRRAAELGLTHEDQQPKGANASVAAADRVLLGVGCCLLAAGSAALSIWMVVPTLVVSGVAAALLVRHLNAASSVPRLPTMGAEFQLGGDAVKRMMAEDQERFVSANLDSGSDPMYRTSPSNIFYDDHHHS